MWVSHENHEFCFMIYKDPTMQFLYLDVTHVSSNRIYSGQVGSVDSGGWKGG